jgi:hypothetical protein
LNIAANDFRSLARKQARGGSADPAVRPGNDGDFSLQTTQAFLEPWMFISHENVPP